MLGAMLGVVPVANARRLKDDYAVSKRGEAGAEPTGLQPVCNRFAAPDSDHRTRKLLLDVWLGHLAQTTHNYTEVNVMTGLIATAVDRRSAISRRSRVLRNGLAVVSGSALAASLIAHLEVNHEAPRH